MNLSQFGYLALLLTLPALLFAQQRKAPSFTPGERDIFIDSLWNEIYGEVPSLWTVSRGGIENMQMEDQPVIGFTDGINEIAPRMESNDYLPKTFTIELEVYFHNVGNEGYTIEFNKGRFGFRINRQGINYRPGYIRTEVEELVGWRKVQVAVNGSSLKVYYNGERLVNHPDMGITPTELQLSVLSHGNSRGNYAMIRNIRIAEGGGTLYDRFNTTGILELNNIQFDYNKASIRPDAQAVIARLANMLKSHPELKVQIEGHTDSRGAADFNQALSERRAAAVKQALIDQEIASDRMQTIGYGEEQPLDTADTPQAWAVNRRVTFRKL